MRQFVKVSAIVASLVTKSFAAGSDGQIVSSAYTVPGVFPTSLYKEYYNNPTATNAQPQPVISDPANHEIYPLSLTDPSLFAKNDTTDPHPLPPTASSSQLLEAAFAQVKSIAANPAFGGNACAQCQAGLEVAKFLSMAAPEQVPSLLVQLCEYFEYSSTCANQYSLIGVGNYITQVLAYADVGGYDGQSICSQFIGYCDLPPASPLNLTSWFAKPKPDPLPAPKQPSGQLLKVLHVSDLHIDPRYTNGAEANCTSGMCCRPNVYNDASPDTPIFPAPRYGAYLCDAPVSLMTAAFEAIPPLTGTEEDGFDWTIFTGDLVSHDPQNQLSRAYVEYSEVILYELLQHYFGKGSIYPTLGNHDTYNEAMNAPYAIGGILAEQFNWDYDHVSKLWLLDDWVSDTTAEFARTHYAAYMVKRADGLRIISVNSNFWYAENYFNYINMTNPDVSGILRFLTDELQDAEDAGDRVWIIGHVLTGWSDTQANNNPTNLFYQIVERYSPHVIANTFFGHTHEDQLTIFYANNGTNPSAETALTPEWICPSLTPYTNLNSGFRVYEVDSATFDIVNAYTWKASVNTFPDLDNQTKYGPTYEFEYSTREAYGGNITWGANDPLNATWWHLVTEAMEADPTLVQTFNTYQGKSSAETAPCTGECITAKICYMRSASVAISADNCNQNYDSVQ